MANYKQLLDEVLVISRIIKVEVGRLPRPWLFWISLKPNLITVLLYSFFADGTQHKASELHMITLRNHAPLMHDMITRDLDCPWHDYCIESAVMTSQELISKIHCTVSANQERDSEFNV